MILAEKIILLFVSILHFYFLILEMYFWTKPIGLKAFKQTKETALNSKTLAANQGLYNGFLALGILLSTLMPQHNLSNYVKIYLLGCVVLAGLYGGYTANKKIFLIQGIPGIIGLTLVLLNI